MINSQIETNTVEPLKTDNFLFDVMDGLKQVPKRLSSKYFYDKIGDTIFQKIMVMPEYYLTNCELDIFKNRTQELASSILTDDEPFDLIELGAGDAMKSTYLLRHFTEKGMEFTYMPIDISGNILSILSERLSAEIPALEIKLLRGDYFDMLDKAAGISNRKKVVLFLGSNIGNMSLEEATHFCHEVKRKLNPGDLFVIGFDLKKDPHIILNAYNDSTGITAAFNLNLLNRINRELEGDFNLNNFKHYQTYDPLSGACKSFLVSLCPQKVAIRNSIYDFEENELIDMEISQKFSQKDIEKLATESGFQISNEIRDSKNWFVDSIWKIS